MRTVLSLIVDAPMLEAVSRQIAPLAIECAFAFEIQDFWDMLAASPYDVVIAERASFATRAESFIARVKRLRPDAFLLLLGRSEDDGPVSYRRTARLELPLPEGAIARALLRAAGDTLSESVSCADGIVGKSAAMRDLKERIQLFAGAESTVLIEGESGTGKEMVAMALHASSARRDGPFVALNCGAIPSEIVESELFGHLKGSFTSADRDRAGYFELASGGSLFLDEIGTMRLDHQVRLLRVLQDGYVTPVGSTKPVRVDVRVIAATNMDLGMQVAEGRFREDLFYRINVLRLDLAPLREHREDIPELARHFVGRYARRRGVKEKEISQGALARLMVHPWRGNVRELENAIEHAMVLSQAESTIRPYALPAVIGASRPGAERRSLRLTSEGIDLNEAVSGIERDMILQSLEIASGNKSKAAELLHLKRTTFVEKMKRLNLVDTDDAAAAS